MKPLTQWTQVYCLGLGGVGVSAVARFLLDRGVTITGSDPQRNPLVDDVIARGAVWYADEDPSRLRSDCSALVYTDDAGADHPIRQRAKELAIPEVHFAEVLGWLMDSARTRIAVAGTNGKSTTTAMLGLLAAGAGWDPSVFVGSRVSEFQGNVRIGQAKTFIAEADEYRDHYRSLRPNFAVVTNVEADHLDYFGSVERMEESFRAFLQSLPPDGYAIVNADDPGCLRIARDCVNIVKFGQSPDADLRITDWRTSAGCQTWTLAWRGKDLGVFTLPLPGLFNCMNATAAIAAALAAGIPPETFARTLQEFHGVWRRFQILNPGRPITVVSDYAHHPTAVAATVVGAKDFFPNRRVLAVFQPHHRSRLTALFSDFIQSFSRADEVYIVETYSVPGRAVPESETRTAKELVGALTAQHRSAQYLARPDDMLTVIPEAMRHGDVIVVMGAGNIWRQAETLARSV